KSDDGGRRTPIRSEFRTDVSFKDEIRMVLIEFEKEFLSPGDEYSVIVKMWLHNEKEANFYSLGKEYYVLEGAKKIGLLKDVILDKWTSLGN
ncbi:MAG: hypothetical protein P8104_13185, partial [Gammaproteobacteria bacterium]